MTYRARAGPSALTISNIRTPPPFSVGKDEGDPAEAEVNHGGERPAVADRRPPSRTSSPRSPAQASYCPARSWSGRPSAGSPTAPARRIRLDATAHTSSGPGRRPRRRPPGFSATSSADDAARRTTGACASSSVDARHSASKPSRRRALARSALNRIALWRKCGPGGTPTCLVR